MNDLEKNFHNDLLRAYDTAKKELKYNPARFYQMLIDPEIGGYKAAQVLIRKKNPSEGFKTLFLSGRTDLSVEAHVIKPEYATLFTEEEIQFCRELLGLPKNAK